MQAEALKGLPCQIRQLQFGAGVPVDVVSDKPGNVDVKIAADGNNVVQDGFADSRAELEPEVVGFVLSRRSIEAVPTRIIEERLAR
jgi:hypothetical protein